MRPGNALCPLTFPKLLMFVRSEIQSFRSDAESCASICSAGCWPCPSYKAAVTVLGSSEFADKLNERKLAQLEEAKQASIQQIQDAIDLEKSQQALVQKLHYLFDVQRNNTAVALEVTYQERLYKVYKEVKNRRDYHISVQNMMRRKEQQHMINWVEKHVVQSISAQQKKETTAKCIADLKLLAKKAQAQPVM
uniref:ATP synthase subunit b n=1 Tax=Macaca nemestrina TaxID=9545 RepID=A0A2K6B0J3_MACNE